MTYWLKLGAKLPVYMPTLFNERLLMMPLSGPGDTPSRFLMMSFTLNAHIRKYKSTTHNARTHTHTLIIIQHWWERANVKLHIHRTLSHTLRSPHTHTHHSSSPLISTSKQNVMCLDCTLICLLLPVLSSVTAFFLIQDVPEFKKLIMLFPPQLAVTGPGWQTNYRSRNQMCKIWRLLELICSTIHQAADREIVFTYLNVNWEWTNAAIFTN